VYSVDLNIFEYDDFRKFLKNSVEQLRAQGSDFSYRKFSQLAGFSSPNFLILLMKGERNLSQDSASKIANAFGLEKVAKNFFVSLVKYNQAKTHEDKFILAQELIKLRSKNKLYFIGQNEFEYYSHWINIAIRELLLINSNLTVVEIANQLSPPQKISDVESALELLQEIGLINFVDSQWQVFQKNISTGENFVSSSVVHFHKQVLGLASESLDRYSRTEREISTSTVALNKIQFEAVRKKIQELRSEILALAEATAPDSDATKEIYQISFQGFPLTQMTKSKRGNYEN
jgi:uncharacterized protein (TIGR02147 family)